MCAGVPLPEGLGKRPESGVMRKATVKRKTNETEISVTVNLDGTGTHDISTGIGFLDHMLDQLAKHSLIDITVRAKGDLHIDFHHTAEDVGIALGEAVKKALGDKRGIRRYASSDLPMDGALTRVAIDVSGRPFLVWKVEFSTPQGRARWTPSSSASGSRPLR